MAGDDKDRIEGTTAEPTLAEHLAKWQANYRKEIEERRRLAAMRRKEKEELRKSTEKPSAKRTWGVRADAPEVIEIPLWATELTAAPADLKTVDDVPDIALAPGCFGLAMTFRPDAKECLPCPFHPKCRIEAAGAWHSLTAYWEREGRPKVAERRDHDRRP
jgi:hypothetical protein